MTVPPKERWFDDHEPSEVFEFGEYLVTQVETSISPAATTRNRSYGSGGGSWLHLR